jgi:hypothetical protein
MATPGETVDLAESLTASFAVSVTRTGGGVVIKNATFIGCSQADQASSYTGGARLGLKPGVVLSTGFISQLAGGSPGSCRGAGYAPLDELVTGPKRQRQQTVDAAVLEVEFDCGTDSDYYQVTLDYVFASSEYSVLSVNETTEYNDIAAVFLNGVKPSDNIATIDGQPVSVNTIRGRYYVDRSSGMGGLPIHGMSVPLQAVGRTTTKTNMIRIAVADTLEITYNSYMFVSSLDCQALDRETMPSTHPSIAPASTLAPTSEPGQTPELKGFRIESATALELAGEIVDETSVTITNASLVREACNGTSSSLFKGGAESISLGSGIVLSNGHASSLIDGDSGVCDGRTFGPLEQLVTEGFTTDATVLEIHFECNIENVCSCTGSGDDE